MEFELSEQDRMLKELVHRFVRDELMPLEAGVLAREAQGKGLGLEPGERKRLDEVSHKLGLWGLDAQEAENSSVDRLAAPALLLSLAAMSARRQSVGIEGKPKNWKKVPRYS